MTEAGKSHVSHPSYAHVSVPYLRMLFFSAGGSFTTLATAPQPPPGGGGFPYDRGENACRLF